MRKLWFIVSTVILALTANAINAQTDCKVMNPKIGDSYTGSCKNGLADGKGEAFGVDQYTGEFKKGLPEGIGTYIWQTGEKYEGSWKKGMRDGDGSYFFKSDGRDTVLKGVWEKDKYVGEKLVAPYSITYRLSISRATITRTGDIPYVVYKFSRPGGSLDDIQDLLLQGSSGHENNSNNFLGFEQITFPFEGKIRFMAPNALKTAVITCELQYKINQPGSWTVTIYY